MNAENWGFRTPQHAALHKPFPRAEAKQRSTCAFNNASPRHKPRALTVRKRDVRPQNETHH